MFPPFHSFKLRSVNVIWRGSSKVFRTFYLIHILMKPWTTSSKRIVNAWVWSWYNTQLLFFFQLVSRIFVLLDSSNVANVVPIANLLFDSFSFFRLLNYTNYMFLLRIPLSRKCSKETCHPIYTQCDTFETNTIHKHRENRPNTWQNERMSPIHWTNRNKNLQNKCSATHAHAQNKTKQFNTVLSIKYNSMRLSGIMESIFVRIVIRRKVDATCNDFKYWCHRKCIDTALNRTE